MSILITGFEPNDDGLNASKILVESLRDDPPGGLLEIHGLLRFAVLPNSTRQLQASLLELVARHRPVYCLFTGQAQGRNKVSFERLATNLRDFGAPDGEGHQPCGELIEADGPVAYWSSLPNQAAFVEKLDQAGIPAALSNHGGNNLCNQVLYHGLHYAATQGVDMKCGFLHLPPLPMQTRTQWPDTPFIPLDMAREALTLILVELAGMSPNGGIRE